MDFATLVDDIARVLGLGLLAFMLWVLCFPGQSASDEREERVQQMPRAERAERADENAEAERAPRQVAHVPRWKRGHS